MIKSPKIEEVKGKVFGVFTIKDSFSDGLHIYFTCTCSICNNTVNKTWNDLNTSLNKFCNNCRTSPILKPKGEAAFNRLLGIYKDSAKRRGLKWELTKEQFKNLTSSNCHYCGTPPEQIVKGANSIKGKYKLNGQYLNNGVDRKDSKKSYQIDNCVSCCKYCNIGKNDQSYKDYLDRIKRIYYNCIKDKSEINLTNEN